MKKRTGSWGKAAIAFGVGLIVALILPAAWLVAILAAILIVFGIVCLR